MRQTTLTVCFGFSLLLAGCMAGEEADDGEWGDAPGDLDELYAITCNGPQGDAYGEGPNGAGVKREIREAWGNDCRERQAISIAQCEGGHWSNCCANGGGTKAHYNVDNQYKGMFQMGSWERQTYGFSWCAGGQARGAHRYYLDRGWAPWSCNPASC